MWLLALLGVCGAASPARAANIGAERAAFLKAYASAQLGSEDWRAQAATLTDYPLYPYLEATYLEHTLHKAGFDEVAAYLKRYPGLIPAEDLRRNFLYLLAHRKDWHAFLALYRPESNDTLACYALQARLARGEKLDFARDLATLWREPSLPASCNAVQAWAHDHGLLTKARLWRRIERAADARRSDTIASLALWLPHKDAVVARRLVSALRHPAGAVRAAAHWSDTVRNRKAAMLAVTQLARGSSASAVRAWPRLRQHFHFPAAMQDRILRSLALHRAYDFGDDALALLAALPDTAEDDATRAWRVRIAVAGRNWSAALAGLDALDATQKQEDSWRYLRARVLQKLGEHEKARAGFTALANAPDYWGFLAADHLDTAYAICPSDPPSDAAREQALLARPGFTRAFELFAVGMLHDARREWLHALRDTDVESQQLIADLAFRRGWYSRAIFTYSYGDSLHFYQERFPFVYRKSVNAAARETGLDPAWIYALIRAESAWIPDAGSRADARGLMQLRPGTARRVAHRHHIRFDGNLFEPRMNIVLGTHYLARMMQRYNGAPWLAAAAYNAGPIRVDEWLDARAALDPDLFVATIPYRETRRYVVAVMAYSVIYDWLLNGKPVSLLRRMAPHGKTVAPPGATAPRAAVICPPPVTTVIPAAVQP